MSFNQGVFPNTLKIANVIPIHKKDDKLTIVTSTDQFPSYLILAEVLKNLCTFV